MPRSLHAYHLVTRQQVTGRPSGGATRGVRLGPGSATSRLALSSSSQQGSTTPRRALHSPHRPARRPQQHATIPKAKGRQTDGYVPASPGNPVHASPPPGAAPFAWDHAGPPDDRFGAAARRRRHPVPVSPAFSSLFFRRVPIVGFSTTSPARPPPEQYYINSTASTAGCAAVMRARVLR